MSKFVFVTFILFFTYACSDSLSEKQKEEYIVKGNQIVLNSTKALEYSLGQEMKNGGVEGAIPFCNTMAYSLTEKLSESNEAVIKRTSDKIRNEKNKPNEEEMEILAYYKKLHEESSPLEPVVELNKKGKISYYTPILIKKKCLTCHGVVGKEMTSRTDSIIKSYYKMDMATDYTIGDLRGIWSINLSK